MRALPQVGDKPPGGRAYAIHNRRQLPSAAAEFVTQLTRPLNRYRRWREDSVVNPAFGEAVGVAREQLRDRSLLDVFTAVDSAAVEQLTDALLRRQHGRFPLDVRWTAGGHALSGYLTAELVDEALLGELPCWSSFTSIALSPNGNRR
jgi:hypothetical protein